MVVRANSLERSMARYLRDRIAASGLDVWLDSEVRALGGDQHLEQITVQRVGADERQTIDAGVLVVLIGAAPRTDWLPGTIGLDDEGFVRTGPSLPAGVADREPWLHLNRAPFLVETSLPGVFAVGDVRSGSTKMVAPAVGEGGMAVRFVAEHLARTGQRRTVTDEDRLVLSKRP